MSRNNPFFGAVIGIALIGLPVHQVYALTDTVPAIPQSQPDVVAGTPDVKVKPFAPEGAAKEVAAINERLAVLSAQLAELEVQAKIAAKIAEINKLESAPLDSIQTTTSPPNLGAAPIPPLPVSSKSPLFEPFSSVMVRDIEGVDGQLRATLILENGNRQVVRKGDKVGDLLITGISLDMVQAQEGKQKINLPFYDDTARSDETARD